MRWTRLGLLLAFALVAGPARGQVVFDDTFGTPGAAPRVGSTLLVEESRGGIVAGGGRAHLLHSFSAFGVAAGETVEFRTSDAIDVILSRVTGGDASRIAGDVRVRNDAGVGGPDLFLLNPNGILFDGNARLDLDGAFFATTAQAIGFEDDALFSAADPLAPLPTTAAPPAFLRFDAGGVGDVVFDGGRLQSFTSSGRQKATSVGLVGRNVIARGLGGVIVDDATLGIAAVGSGALDLPIDLATLTDRSLATGSILIDAGNTAFTMQTNSAELDQGRIVVRGGELVLIDAAMLAAGDGRDGADTVAIDIAVGGDVRLEGSRARIDSDADETVGPGGIDVTADRIAVGAGSSIGITHNGTGGESGRIVLTATTVELDGPNAAVVSTSNGTERGGDIEIRTDRLVLADDARLATEVLAGATGAGGAIDVVADRVDVLSLAEIESDTAGAGAGGDLRITADAISIADADPAPVVGLPDFSQIATRTSGTARGGRIELDARSLTIGAGARLLSEGVGVAGESAGEIGVRADRIGLDDRADVLSVTAADRDGGDISITGEALAADGFARIVAGSVSSGRGGSVTLEIDEIDLRQGVFVATGPVVEPPPGEIFEGASGAVAIRARRLSLSEGAQVSTTTEGAGDAGDLVLRVSGALEIEGEEPGGNRASGLFARSGLGTGSLASGRGGAIDVEAGRLSIREGGQIGIESLGTGDAGSVSIRVGRFEATTGAGVSANAVGSGATGAIRIDSQGDVRLASGARIASSVPVAASVGASTPDGVGDIEIAAGGVVEVVDAEISTESARLESGRIRLSAGRSVTVLDSRASTTIDSPSGRGGDIRVDTNVLAVAGGGITANALGSNAAAGDVLVVASEGLVVAEGGVIEARADQGIAGTVVLSGPVTNLPGELATLAAEPRDASDTLRDPCLARNSSAGSFEIRPRAIGELDPGEGPITGCGTR